MGSVDILQSGRFSALRALNRAFRLAAIAALALGFAPSRAAAQTTTTTTINDCQATPITTNVVLGNNIIASSGWTGPCITVGADGLTIDLSTFTLDVSQTGSPTVAIENGTHNNTTITSSGGTIITNFPYGSTASAIDSQGGINLSITSVTLENEPGNTPCALTFRTTTNGGTGISISSMTGASISANTVYCYQTGIFVQNSAIPRKGTGNISGNNLHDNSYDMKQGTAGVNSAGLILNNSSGWTVSGNTIDYNGSYDANSGCTYDATTNVMSCAFALQVVNSSSGNDVSNNTVNNNFGGGIYADATTSSNKFVGNTVLNNTVPDIFDEGSHNGWHKNVCTSAGGNLGPNACQ
jgi:parallel beta-helix repeat protein